MKVDLKKIQSAQANLRKKNIEKSKNIKESKKYEEVMEIEEVKGENMDDKTDAITFIEKHYPETAKEFQKLQFEQYHLFCKKQMDYGPTNIAMGTSLETKEEKRLSLVGLIVRINDKVQRLLNLMVKNNREAQNEPSIDAFKDLACYGIIAQIVQNGKWGK